MTNLENFREMKFPIDVFPHGIQELIYEVTNTLTINVDYACSTMVFTFASAIGNQYEIKVKNGWKEGSSIFIALVGKPGINKSSPISIFTAPLEKLNNDLFEVYRHELKEYRDKKADPENKEKLIEPVLKQIIIKDITQEAMLLALFHNPQGLCCINDELASFLKSFNKYRGGGGDEELILSLFSGKSISVNRKNGDQLLIPNPTLSIIGSIQPQVLISLFGNNRIDNGLTHRFLWCFPDNVKREELSSTEMDREVLDAFEAIIQSIIKKNNATDWAANPKTIRLSPDAFSHYQHFRRRINEIINNENSDAISGIYAKLDTLFFRLCLILHQMWVVCLEEPNKDFVQLETAKRAEKLIEYFEYMALKVFGLFEKHRDPLIEYPMEKKIFYYQLPQTFTSAQAEEIAAGRFSKRTIFKTLADGYLFTKLKHGHYEKVW